MTDSRKTLVQRVATLLLENGETTRRTILVAKELGEKLGIGADLFPGWGTSTLKFVDASGNAEYSIFTTQPVGANVQCVSEIERAVVDVPAERLDAEIDRVVALPAVSDLRFILMSVPAAMALTIIFGMSDLATIVGAGIVSFFVAVIRRAVARLTANPFLQPLAGALTAGLCGAIAARSGFVGTFHAQWIAAMPSILLAPGPHLLNGCLDLARLRTSLGIARLAFAGIVIVMISMGLIAGLACGALVLSPLFNPRHASLVLDMISAGIAAATIATYLSMSWKDMIFPVVIAMLAHASRWAVLAGTHNIVLATLVACFIVGTLVTLATNRLRMPFGAMAFAASIAMLPAAYLFHMASGTMALLSIPPSAPEASGLLTLALRDAVVAAYVSGAIAFGLIAPKMFIDYVHSNRINGSRLLRPR